LRLVAQLWPVRATASEFHARRRSDAIRCISSNTSNAAEGEGAISGTAELLDAPAAG